MASRKPKKSTSRKGLYLAIAVVVLILGVGLGYLATIHPGLLLWQYSTQPPGQTSVPQFGLTLSGSITLSQCYSPTQVDAVRNGQNFTAIPSPQRPYTYSIGLPGDGAYIVTIHYLDECAGGEHTCSPAQPLQVKGNTIADLSC